MPDPARQYSTRAAQPVRSGTRGSYPTGRSRHAAQRVVEVEGRLLLHLLCSTQLRPGSCTNHGARWPSADKPLHGFDKRGGVFFHSPLQGCLEPKGLQSLPPGRLFIPTPSGRPKPTRPCIPVGGATQASGVPSVSFSRPCPRQVLKNPRLQDPFFVYGTRGQNVEMHKTNVTLVVTLGENHPCGRPPNPCMDWRATQTVPGIPTSLANHRVTCAWQASTHR